MDEWKMELHVPVLPETDNIWNCPTFFCFWHFNHFPTKRCPCSKYLWWIVTKRHHQRFQNTKSEIRKWNGIQPTYIETHKKGWAKFPMFKFSHYTHTLGLNFFRLEPYLSFISFRDISSYTVIHLICSLFSAQYTGCSTRLLEINYLPADT